MIDRSGAIVSRTFEQPYQERRSATSILALLSATAPGQSTTLRGGQATFVLSASDAVAAVGHRVTLSIRVTPGPKMHVYAPGQKDYISIELATTAAPEFKAAPPTYPAPVDFYYAPLRETVKVYDKPFRIAQDVTIASTAELRRRAAAGESLKVAGTLDYQACDDAVCYRPESVKVSWTIPLQRMP